MSSAWRTAQSRPSISGSRATAPDIDACLASVLGPAVGWPERALFDAIEIAALFNYMNRIIEGTGVTYDYEANPPTEQEREMRKTRSYADFGKMIGIE